MVTTWLAVSVAFTASAFLARELAEKRGRDARFYFFTGLFLGPLALLALLAPLPVERGGRPAAGERELRVVEGDRCPSCRRDAGKGSMLCPYCGYQLEKPWWDRPLPIGRS